MEQPNNPYQASVIDPIEPSLGSHHALIESLDVSDKWKRKFHIIDDMENIKDPKAKKAYFKNLSWGERFGQSNILAFFFSWIYFFIKGMWKAGIAYFCLILVLILGLVIFNIESDSISRAVGIGFGALVSTRANIIYYYKKVLGKDLWM